MQTQHQPSRRGEQSFSPAMGSFFQQQENGLWDKEKPYWQKFLAPSRYFDDSGMVWISQALPASEFFNYLNGLNGKRETAGEADSQRANRRNEAESPAWSVPLLFGQSKKLFSAPEKQESSQPVYGIEPLSPVNEPVRYSPEAATPIQNTEIYQSYLQQQIHEYRYQTQLYQGETHLHPTTIFQNNSGQKKPRPIRENGLSSVGQSLPVTRLAETIIPGAVRERVKSQTADDLPMATVAGAESVAPWQPLPLLSGETETAAGTEPPDWSGLASLLKQNIAETFTELLQNMIPETEGR